MPQNVNSIVIVTGATGSIGTAIATELCSRGCAVLLACRNMERAEHLRSLLLCLNGCGEVLTAPLDLASFDSIRRFAKHIASLNRPIAALVNNAGVMCRHYSVTADGFEQTLAVNYLGTVLLTQLLLPLMADGASITFTTSITRKIHSLKEPILNATADQFSQLGTYGGTKLALTHYALYLTTLQEITDRHIRVNCADPGIVDSGMITMHRWYDTLANIFFRPFISSPEVGASSALSAIDSPLTGMIFKHRHHPHSIARDLRPGDATLRSTLISTTRLLVKCIGH